MILVVAAVLVEDLAAPNRILAARRRAPAALAGYWEFPGGKVEPSRTAAIGGTVDIPPTVMRPDIPPTAMRPDMQRRAMAMGIPPTRSLTFR